MVGRAASLGSGMIIIAVISCHDLSDWRREIIITAPLVVAGLSLPA
jgi:hypothetical protein